MAGHKNVSQLIEMGYALEISLGTIRATADNLQQACLKLEATNNITPDLLKISDPEFVQALKGALVEIIEIAREINDKLEGKK